VSPLRWAGFLFIAVCACAHAAKYALLIGINHYSPGQGIADLEGPVNDAASLRRVLISAWQFRPENVQSLVDEAASRAHILTALDGYAETLKPGDLLFLFYSGHGTSWYAKGGPQTGIAVDTGALVSADLKLIVGNQDLQPRLRKLDSLAQVFAVFDSCYSGNSIKSIAVAPARYVPPEAIKSVPTSSLDQYDRQFSDFQRFTAIETYPYRHVLYLSAASKAEQAADIPRMLISHGFRTVDGQPHGALSNALLRGLNGEADTNHDGRITYEELYFFVRKSVTGQFTQTPQFLFPANDPSLAVAPVFSVASAPQVAPAAAAPAPSELRVKLESGAESLRARVAALPSVTVGTDPFDLLVRRRNGTFELYHRSGTLIQTYASGAEDEVLRRIQCEPEVRKLIDAADARQSFNVSLTVEPAGRGFYSLGERLSFRARAEQQSYGLLLNIDVSGMITLLGPVTKLAPGRDTPIGPNSKVDPPTGMEYMKLFAFLEKPAGIDEILAEAQVPFAPDSPLFDKLLRIVVSHAPRMAVAQVKLVTTE
jgi:hypothetical protein